MDKYEKEEVVKNFDRLNTLKFSTVAPTAFTERGLYMLATILKGERAEKTTLAILCDTFMLNQPNQKKINDQLHGQLYGN